MRVHIVAGAVAVIGRSAFTDTSIADNLALLCGGGISAHTAIGGEVVTSPSVYLLRCAVHNNTARARGGKYFFSAYCLLLDMSMPKFSALWCATNLVSCSKQFL